jgi:hypothetical protein
MASDSKIATAAAAASSQPQHIELTTSAGAIRIKLRWDAAPLTCALITKLVTVVHATHWFISFTAIMHMYVWYRVVIIMVVPSIVLNLDLLFKVVYVQRMVHHQRRIHLVLYLSNIPLKTLVVL